MYVNRHGCTHTHSLSLTHTHTHAYESEHRARHVSRTRACVTAHLCLRSTSTHVPARALLIFMRVCVRVSQYVCTLFHMRKDRERGREGERRRRGLLHTYPLPLRSLAVLLQCRRPLPRRPPCLALYTRFLREHKAPTEASDIPATQDHKYICSQKCALARRACVYHHDNIKW